MLYFRNKSFELHVEIFPNLVNQHTMLIHGNLASNRWWYPAIEVWQGKARQNPKSGMLIAAEWRGCGKSTKNLDVGDLDMKELSQDYLALLGALHLDHVDVIGHSTGGLIALGAMLEAPAAFRRAVLLDSVAPKGFQLEPAMLDAFAQMSRDRKVCEMVMTSTIHNVKASPFFDQIVDDAFGVSGQVWTGVPVALQNAVFMDRLSELKQPILVMHGEHDPVLQKEDSRMIADFLGNATYIELANHGHSLNVEDPEKFVQLVDEFLKN